jgi:Glyoxalase-like domain
VFEPVERVALSADANATPASRTVHLEVRVAGRGSDDERWARITEAVDRLTTAGATALQHLPSHHVVMADPEGNEFCVLLMASTAVARDFRCVSMGRAALMISTARAVQVS